MEPDSRMGRRRVLAGIAGLSAASLASGAVVSPASAQHDYVYEPPAGYEIDDLVEIYNQNLDAVPGWFRDTVLTADQILVSIFQDRSMDGDDGFDLYRLNTGADGRVTSILGGAAITKQGDRITVLITEHALDSIIVADDPDAEARKQYAADYIQLRSEGNFVRGLTFWLSDLFR